MIGSIIALSDVFSLCQSRERVEQMLKALAGSTLSRDQMINNFTNPGFRLHENLGHCLSCSRPGMVRCPLKDKMREVICVLGLRPHEDSTGKRW